MRLPALALLLALLLPGCLVLNLEPAGPRLVVNEATEAAVQLPPPDNRTPPPGAESQNAPLWYRGERWNYTILDPATGRERGYAHYEMLGAVNLSGTIAYEVRELRLRLPSEGRPEGAPPENVSVRTLHYDFRTLDVVWYGCSGEWMSLSPCAGRYPEMNLPLWDGKSWSAMCCGDVPVNQTWNASRLADGSWHVERTDEFCGAEASCRDWARFDPGRRHVVEAKKGDERWVLQD